MTLEMGFSDTEFYLLCLSLVKQMRPDKTQVLS